MLRGPVSGFDLAVPFVVIDSVIDAISRAVDGGDGGISFSTFFAVGAPVFLPFLPCFVLIGIEELVLMLRTVLQSSVVDLGSVGGAGFQEARCFALLRVGCWYRGRRIFSSVNGSPA